SVEKSVGQSWSDPAVGEAVNGSGKFMVVVGSGFLPYSQQQGSNRSNVVAGTTLYILDAETGLPVSGKDVGNDGAAENVDDCAAANNCQIMKNALQADPVATGPADSRYLNRAYIGDLAARVSPYNISHGV